MTTPDQIDLTKPSLQLRVLLYMENWSETREHAEALVRHEEVLRLRRQSQWK